jgi:NitT/TauT family transport system ATP-binding protein
MVKGANVMSEAPFGAVVQVERAEKTFVTPNGPLLVLDNVSFSINAGEFVAVVGPSGCGKSTLLRILAGLDQCSSGRVLVDSAEILRPNDQTGVVFQKPALFPWLNVLANVTFGPRLKGLGTAKCRERALHYLKAVGLEGFEGYAVYNLSGGMQHRVALARALIERPKLLAMDEPFGALDAQTRANMQDLLMRIWRVDRSTVLFITHDVDEALTLADRVLVMTARPGRLKCCLTVDLPRPRDLAIVTSTSFGELKRQIVSAIKEEALVTEALEIEALRSATLS